MTPIENLERVAFEAADELPSIIVRTTVRGIVRALLAVLRDVDRRLAAIEERQRHG